MRQSTVFSAAVLAFALTACSSDKTTAPIDNGGSGALRVVNANTLPVDALVDGTVVLSALAPGQIASADASVGAHVLTLRQTGSATTSTANFTAAATGQRTFAATRSTTGLVAATALDDTGSVVPQGATKVRVLHLAASAGEVQVYRTQPDFGTPIRWQFPFVYTPTPTSLSAPFYQSTVGTWEVRIWLSPADASGWANAPIKLTVPLGSGAKQTIVILDKAGGGIRAELID